MLLFAFWALWAAAAADLTVDVIDVGQGDAILIREGGKAVLIDGGDVTAGDQLVKDLAALRVDHLDLVVATHPHADHIGGLPGVLRTFPVGRYMDNGLPHTTAAYAKLMALVDEHAIPYQAAKRGAKIKLSPDATFTVLFPDGVPLTGTRSDLNANSVVLRLDHGENSFLFVGDAEADTERALVDDGIDPVDVLKVAHHGSEHSSTAAFLDAVAPRIAVISVGEGNKYGHPDDATLTALEARHVEVYRTDRDGTVRLLSDAHTITIVHGPVADLGGAGFDVPENPYSDAALSGVATSVRATPPPEPEPVKRPKKKKKNKKGKPEWTI